MKIYDGAGIILGRLATKVAKDALLGEEVHVVNAEKVIISGKREVTFKEAKENRDRRGYPLKSRKISRLPDHYVRRTIRGMLPWKQSRGKEAFRRIMCHIGVPDEFNNKDFITLEKCSVKKLPTLKYITVGQVCKQLGGKI